MKRMLAVGMIAGLFTFATVGHATVPDSACVVLRPIGTEIVLSLKGYLTPITPSLAQVTTSGQWYGGHAVVLAGAAVSAESGEFVRAALTGTGELPGGDYHTLSVTIVHGDHWTLAGPWRAWVNGQPATIEIVACP
jgi:hypothetical protein